MATEQSFVEYICEQISDAGSITYRKMFGEYMVYVNAKPIILVCDNTPFVKIKDEIKDLMENADTGEPYTGAKEHYVLDIDNSEFAVKVVRILEEITPYPKPKKRKME